MTPHQEVERFERKRGRRFTPAQRQEILQSLGLSLSLGLGANSGTNGGFNGQFASLGWTGLRQLVQSDIGLTYSSALAITAGNTSTTAVTITNSGSTAPCAVRVKATNTLAIGAGGQFSVYTDGGTTPIMTGVTPTAATPVTLTGFSGVALLWSAGTVVTNDTWDACASAWTDQAPSPHSFAGSGTAQPIITPGTGGRLGLKGNGTTTGITSGLDLSGGGAPSATNVYVYVLARMLSTPGANACIAGIPGGTRIGIYCAAGTLSIVQYNGSIVNGSTAVVNTWYLMRAKFIGTTGDSMQLGSSVAVTGASAGNGVPISSFDLFASGGAFFCPCEIMFEAISTSPAPATLGAAITAWCGVTQV